jgi:isopropylmalate/homocitrate/citramalate synthase
MTGELEERILGTRVSYREVGLREGLQSTDHVLPTEAKIALFRGLKEAGVREFNAVAFANPAKMPQMADAEAFLRALGPLREDTTLSGLVFNDRGLERALAMHAEGLLDDILLIFAASPAALAANGMEGSVEPLMERIERSAARAAAADLGVIVFLSTAYGCSIGGRIEPADVVGYAARLHAMEGVRELIVSDSTGQADPLQVLRLLTDLSTVLPVEERLTLHFHDTRGAGLANIFAALLSPFEQLVLDAAFGGWGGDFPFVPEALGNVASEDLLEMLVGIGFDLGVDVERVMGVTREYAQLSGRAIGARLHASGPIQWKRGLAPASTSI